MKHSAFAALIALVSTPVLAQDAPSGDAAAGEQAFARQCVSCHVVVDADGTKLAGRNARTGPNLFGIAGGVIGQADGFRYGDGLITLGERGDVWTEDAFVGYVQNPSSWLKDALDDDSARGKMGYRVRAEQDALDLYAYLASLAE